MKIQTLDANLRQFTNEEQRYLSGDYFQYDSIPASGYYHDEPYLLFDVATSRNIGDQNDVFLLSNYENLAIIKQSRFQKVPFHIHPWVELNYMYSGECILKIKDTVHVLKEGQMSLIDMNCPHSLSECRENDILINFIISKEYLDSNFFNRLAKDNFLTNFFIDTLNSKKSHDNFIIFHSENNSKLSIYIKQFLCEYYDNSIASNNILDCLMTLILCELINTFENDLSYKRQNSSESIVIPIIRYIEHNYNQCTLNSTAEFFNMHPNYLSSYLKRHTGLSYKELIQTQRLQQAASLLKTTSLSVYDISYHVGYSNTSFFFQKFKEKYGCTPKEYRKNPLSLRPIHNQRT
ncbi:MAG: AraC family transcriptional regulator [Eubacteriales bacterium]|nr:AraC family transcriptional regulator [Eubacteriales bacterium]